jgi:hypothetical protein
VGNLLDRLTTVLEANLALERFHRDRAMQMVG